MCARALNACAHAFTAHSQMYMKRINCTCQYRSFFADFMNWMHFFSVELFPIYTIEFPICTRTKFIHYCQNNHKHIFAARFQVTAQFLLLLTSNSQVGLFMKLAMLHRVNVTLADLYLLNWKRKRKNGMETERFGMLSMWLSHSVVIQNSV